MNFQEATLEDIPQIIRLGKESILQGCQKEYTQAQCQAWANALKQSKRWAEAIKTEYFLLAKQNEHLLGFGSIDLKNGYLDFLYVAPTHFRKGVALAIFQQLLKAAKASKNQQIWANVSKTAQPFFLRQGFRTEKNQDNLVNGILLSNYKMTLNLR